MYLLFINSFVDECRTLLQQLLELEAQGKSENFVVLRIDIPEYVERARKGFKVTQVPTLLDDTTGKHTLGSKSILEKLTTRGIYQPSLPTQESFVQKPISMHQSSVAPGLNPVHSIHEPSEVGGDIFGGDNQLHLAREPHPTDESSVVQGFDYTEGESMEQMLNQASQFLEL